ncbi:MAG: glycosyltransferase [Lachnospiraceae bacterium]|nr:glycosyltransferase [Lachnospiraceae bacterium]
MSRISVCSIVKNEEKNIEKMLESVKKYGFEIVVVDTGSTDRTKEIAAKYTDKVFDFEWCDDFAKAKNFAASKAGNDWILFMDADEWIEFIDLEEMEYFIRKYQNAVGSVFMDNITGTPDNPGPPSRIHIERLYDRRKFHYIKPIHEMLAPKYGKLMDNLQLQTVLGHSGYCMDDETRIRKSKRNLELLFRELEEDPENPYLFFQIGKGYQMVNDHENSVKYFEKGLSYHPDEELDYVHHMHIAYEDELAQLKKSRENATLAGTDGNGKDRAKISVIIPCHDVENMIDRCLLSVTGQTTGLDNVEIICVDDKSSDGTVAHLLEWEKKYPENIMVIRCEENHRQGAARNIGLDYASGEYVTFIDADDWVENDYLEKLSAPLKDNYYDMVVTNYGRDTYDGPDPIGFDASKRSTGKEDRAMLIDTDDKRELFIYLQLVPYSACYRLIKRSLLADNGVYFMEDLAYEDTAWGLMTYLYVRSLFFVEENLYHYYVKEDSTILKKNALYHADMLKVQENKLAILKDSGYWGKFREVLEFEHIRSCYLSFLKVLALRYDDPPYDLFVQMKDHINGNIPDCRNNRYIKEGLNDFQKALLDMLYVPVDEEGFGFVMKAIVDHGGV